MAAGHPVTADAAIAILREGGNAFDAALAALFASTVAEPVLSSLGGGGFLMAQPAEEAAVLYDFFAHTPAYRPPESEVNLFPILADFGAARQEFHIGAGSIAVPGVIRGLFAIHRERCRLPLRTLIAPALEAARGGVRVNRFQHYISTVVRPILESSQQALQLHTPTGTTNGRIAEEGETLIHHEAADFMEALAREGEALFYRGEAGQRLVADTAGDGGCLRREDLENYRVERREPLALRYQDSRLITNPPPSLGGSLIAFTLALLEPERLGEGEHLGPRHLTLLAHAMRLTQQLRHSGPFDQRVEGLLDPALIEEYRRTLRRHHPFPRGTTQISIADREGNLASMTLSNGEGSGYVLPGTGIMLNNMLGEEDINPHGFNRWPENRRIASMMAPTLLQRADGSRVATGSGGSNRIRSAIAQVLINLIDFRLSPEQAVDAARIHFEGDVLSLEPGIPNASLDSLLQEFENHHLWEGKNLFFGGAHTVMVDSKGGFQGMGDNRRGGVCFSA